MYCDDNIIGVVGVDRAVRVLKTWLTTNVGLIMAIAEKRSLGTWCNWVGALVFATLGLVVIPKSKLVRASTTICTLLHHGVDFSEYRSLMGLLEHFRDVARVPKHYTHSLYGPHGCQGEGVNGPNALVRPNFFMRLQFAKWLEFVSVAGGNSITSALHRWDLPSAHPSTFIASSDAATDCEQPALGGFIMHGSYWYLPLSEDTLSWLHTTVLELLECGFNAIVFSCLVPPRSRLLLHVDASTTFYSLVSDSARSRALVQAHHALLADERFQIAAARAEVQHASGEGNIAADAVSRSSWDVFHALMRTIKIRPHRVEVPERCHHILRGVVQAAREHGVPVSPSRLPSLTQRTLPPQLLHRLLRFCPNLIPTSPPPPAAFSIKKSSNIWSVNWRVGSSRIITCAVALANTQHVRF